jgi:hypothetical protein
MKASRTAKNNAKISETRNAKYARLFESGVKYYPDFATRIAASKIKYSFGILLFLLSSIRLFPQ